MSELTGREGGRTRARRGALLTAIVLLWELAQPLTIPGKEPLEQNWSKEQRERFWFTPQGSQLIDYRWFLVLEQAGSTELFRSNGHLDALRFVTVPPNPYNPEGLPIGFVKNRTGERVGFTCAACHTSQIDYRDKSFVIDGGPALAHVDRFLEELVAAMDATLAQPGKFHRFATALGEGNGAALRERMEEEVAPLRQRVKSNRVPSSYPAGYPGFGRLDAYGQIFNQVAALDLGIPGNVAVPNAPASYPSLWLAPWADKVQWNGAGLNRLAAGTIVIGPLLRNIVEVVGVFGRLQFDPSPLPMGYRSAVDVIGLGELEGALCRLHAPEWPDAFGKPDANLAARGRTVYEATCKHCHGDVKDEQAHTSPLPPYEVVGTDATYIEQASYRSVDTGDLEGLPKRFTNPLVLFGARAPAYEVLRNAVTGVVLDNLALLVRASELGRCDAHTESKVPQIGDQTFMQELEEAFGKETMPYAYRARALNGVWATAPYLHNGSVPNLVQLLDPSKRDPVFYVGSREFDPVNVGFVSVPGPETTALDTTAPGNSNQGHLFSSHLTDAQRRALLEYLKTI